jgi:hypothetical protein
MSGARHVGPVKVSCISLTYRQLLVMVKAAETYRTGYANIRGCVTKRRIHEISRAGWRKFCAAVNTVIANCVWHRMCSL